MKITKKEVPLYEILEKSDLIIAYASFVKNYRAVYDKNMKLEDFFYYSVLLVDPKKVNIENKYFKTLREAFEDSLDKIKEIITEVLEKEIKKSKKLFRYSITGIILPSNRKKLNEINELEKALKDILTMINDKEKIEEFYKEKVDLKEYKKVKNYEVLTLDVEDKIKVGDSVYIFYSENNLHLNEINITPPFGCKEYKIEEIKKSINIDTEEYKPLFKRANYSKLDIDFKLILKENNEKECFFTEDLKFNEDSNGDYILSQGYSSIRYFLTKEDLDLFVKEFKEKVIKSLNNIYDKY